MKNAKKALILVLCAALLVGASVMGTLAYLTSQTETITNTMSVGNVTITMDEAKVDVYGVPQKLLDDKGTDDPTDDEYEGCTVAEADRVLTNSYKLIPNHEYTKDPIIHVQQGSEQCWLFVKVLNEISAIEADDTIAAQMATNGWTVLDTVSENGQTYTIWWHNVVDARAAAVDVKIFESFTVKGEVSNATVATYTGKTIVLTAYAVQAEGFNSPSEAWTASGFGA